MFELLSKLPFSKGLNFALILFGNVLAPFWFIFQFQRILLDIELVKLILTSLAIGLPITCTLFVLDIFTFDEKDWEEYKNKNAEKTLALFGSCSVITALILYIPCVLIFFSDFPLKKAISFSIYSFIGVLANRIVKIFTMWLQNRLKRKATPPTPQA